MFFKEGAAGTKAMKSSHSRRGNSYRKLSIEEYQARLKMGLCFRCDERYRPNHGCKSKQLQVLIIDEEEELEEPLLEDQGEVEDSKPKVELLRHSVAGLNSLKTMKVWGRIKSKGVVVLLDCEATHNFIAQQLIEELQIPVRLKNFFVTLGDGQKVKGMGVYKNVEIELQGILFK